jgi:four helix bundle protein
MSEFSEYLKERSLRFAVEVLRLVDQLPRTPAGRTVAGQLADSATSVAANYRGSCNARSRREFVAKLGTVVEEADESECWIEIIERVPLLPIEMTVDLKQEAHELRGIFGKSLGTARLNLRRGKSRANQLTR